MGEPTTKAESLADGIASQIGNAPELHELSEGETARLTVGYFKSIPRDTEGVTIGFHFGTGTADTVESVADLIEPRLDKRKFKVSTDQPRYKQNKTWTLGYVDVGSNGGVVDYELSNEYLKPTEQ